jgi:hypothetical protein
MSVMLEKETRVNLQQVMALANRFILTKLPDRFSAGLPKSVAFPTRRLWVVPVMLTYPHLGIVGEVGMVAVDAEQETVVGWTPFQEMEELARQLYQEKKHETNHSFSASTATQDDVVAAKEPKP